MGNLRNRKDSPGFWLSFFLLLGAAAGTVFCNWPAPGWREAIRDAGGGMVTAAMLMKLDFRDLFSAVLKKRLGEGLCLVLFSMTPAARYLFGGAAAYLGFSTAVTVCSLTMGSGLSGIFRYLALILPQAVPYMAVFYVTAWWMEEEEKKMTVPAALLLFLAAVLGAAAESFVNPWITAWIHG
ncbi:MAG: hypothetical protein ACOX8F_04080 [Sakamotonia sp.]|jgi:hypothetical protein